MTLEDIASWVNQQLTFKLMEEQLVLIIDAVQRLGFDDDTLAFQVWSDTLTIYQKLSVETFSADPVAGDVGLPVVGAGGAEGTLISYVNTEDETYLVVESDDDFEDGEAFTITGGTGAGTLADEDAQEGYKGPYAFPTHDEGEPKVRKFLGITTATDAAIFGTEPIVSTTTDDYGFRAPGVDSRNLFKPGRADEVEQTFTFAAAPSRDEVHRWVYWREAPPIGALDDDANLLVPKRYHFNFVAACIKCANLTVAGKTFTRADVEEDLGPWWKSLARKYTPNGRARNRTLNARQSPRVLF